MNESRSVDEGWREEELDSEQVTNVRGDALVSAAATGEWLVNIAEDSVIPMTTTDVVEALRAGRLSDGALVWRAGMEEWAPLANVPPLRLAAGKLIGAAHVSPSVAAQLAPAAPATQQAAEPVPAEMPASQAHRTLHPPPKKPAREERIRRKTLPFGSAVLDNIRPAAGSKTVPLGSMMRDGVASGEPAAPPPAAQANQDAEALAVYERATPSLSFSESMRGVWDGSAAAAPAPSAPAAAPVAQREANLELVLEPTANLKPKLASERPAAPKPTLNAPKLMLTIEPAAAPKGVLALDPGPAPKPLLTIEPVASPKPKLEPAGTGTAKLTLEHAASATPAPNPKPWPSVEPALDAKPRLALELQPRPVEPERSAPAPASSSLVPTTSEPDFEAPTRMWREPSRVVPEPEPEPDPEHEHAARVRSKRIPLFAGVGSAALAAAIALWLARSPARPTTAPVVASQPEVSQPQRSQPQAAAAPANTEPAAAPTKAENTAAAGGVEPAALTRQREPAAPSAARVASASRSREPEAVAVPVKHSAGPAPRAVAEPAAKPAAAAEPEAPASTAGWDADPSKDDEDRKYWNTPTNADAPSPKQAPSSASGLEDNAKPIPPVTGSTPGF